MRPKEPEKKRSEIPRESFELLVRAWRAPELRLLAKLKCVDA